MTDDRIVHELRIALTVEDYERAVAFYRDTLGMPERESWDRPGGRGMILEAGIATLELFDAAQADTLDSIEVGRRVSGTIRFAIEVPDPVAVADRLVASGASREGELVETPWGDRNVRVRAPDGMQMTLFTKTATSSDPGR